MTENENMYEKQTSMNNGEGCLGTWEYSDVCETFETMVTKLVKIFQRHLRKATFKADINATIKAAEAA